MKEVVCVLVLGDDRSHVFFVEQDKLSPALRQAIIQRDEYMNLTWEQWQELADNTIAPPVNVAMFITFCEEGV